MQQLHNHIGMLTEEAIIENTRKGDFRLFEVLIRRYNPVLYKIARGYGFNHQDAEDLLQDTHVAAYLALEKFENRSSYKTWISKIMINLCLYKLKYGYFKNEVPSEVVSQAAALPLHSKIKEGQTENIVLNRELSLVLEKSIQKIPLNYRIVFVLREMEEFSVAETAALLAITPTNVKVRLNRAKTMLQKEIEQFYTSSDLFSFDLIYCDGLVKKVFEKMNDIQKKSICSFPIEG